MGRTSKALVGIFMPAYNQGKYIHEAIESLKKQTFQDFIVHIVDDGSTDNETPAILNHLNYEKAIVFPNKVNKGVVARSKQHFKLFDTKYILIFCADDILDSHFLEKTVSFLEKNKKYGAVSTNIRYFTEDPNAYYYTHEYSLEKMEIKHMLSKCNMLGSSLIRNKALKETDLSGGFTKYQDWDRWISMLEAGWKIGLINEPLFYYRQVSNSLSHTISIDSEIDVRRRMLKKHSKNYKKFYKEVFLDSQRMLLETINSKNWLDEQYHAQIAEIKKLKAENKKLKARHPLKSFFYLIKKAFKKLTPNSAK